MSATYAAVYSVLLPKAAQVVDPFHVISLANRSLDAIRRRVQIEQLGHRGWRDDPLYRARRLLLMGEEKLSDEATERLSSLLELGDPGAEVAIAYRVKERLRVVASRIAYRFRACATGFLTNHVAGAP
jgi:transposase